MSWKRLNSLIEADSDKISVDGTLQLCDHLGTDAEDVALLALALELKSPAPGEWERKGWIDGWRALGYAFHINASFC